MTVMSPKFLFGLGKEVAEAWSADKSLRLGASLAFYTIFAISPLFVIVLALASMWFGEEAARHHLFDQLQSLLGREGGEAVQAVIASSTQPKGKMWTFTAIITLIVGSTGVFVELQDALNTIWHVEKRRGSTIRRFIVDRLLSFAMVLSIGFLLLVSLVISAALAAVGKYVSGYLPALEATWHLTDILLSFAVVTVLFAMIFKVLPDVHIAWRDVWLGAMLSSILFNLGKFALGFYLGRNSVTSSYGAAGSLVVIISWVYYSSQSMFLGAEFARVMVERSKHAKASKKESKTSSLHHHAGQKHPASAS